MVFPDLRFLQDNLVPPASLYKSNILNPDKPKRDFLFNLYFSKPDYEDPHKKFYYSAVLGAKIGGFFALTEVASMDSRNPSLAFQLAVKRFYFVAAGIITYGTVATTVANLRGKKDDYWNHAIAGASSLGFLWGYARKCTGRGWTAAAFGAAGGLVLKWLYVEDRRLFKDARWDEINAITGGEDYHDWRIIKHRNFNYHEDVPRTEHYVN